MGGNIPGFKYVKDRVIKPLLVATEKVVEYYFNEEPAAIENVSITKDDKESLPSHKTESVTQEGSRINQSEDSLSTSNLQRKFDKM